MRRAGEVIPWVRLSHTLCVATPISHAGLRRMNAIKVAGTSKTSRKVTQPGTLES